MKITLRCFLLLVFSSLIFAVSIHAQLSITTLNTTYTQNFDGVGDGDLALIDDITGPIPGFYAFRAIGNTSPNTVYADSGLETFAGFRNYGPAFVFERALGILPGPATGEMRYGVRFANNAGVPINSVEVTYTGEQWRDGGNGIPQTLVFDYRRDTNVNDITTGIYTPVPALAFTTPTNSLSATALDGNNPANRTVRTATFAVTILPGQEIMLRWTDLEVSGEDHGIAIDDLSVTARGASTAGGANIEGRTVNASGRGLNRVRVTLSGGNLADTVYALTNAFGVYRFENVAAGQTYTIRVESRRHRFSNTVRVINLGEDLADLDFVAEP